MSTTMRAYVSIRPSDNAHAAVQYVVLGEKEKLANNRENGTTRLAGMFCDSPSPEEFIKDCQQKAKLNRRRVQVHTIIVSPPLGTYQADSSEDMQRMVDDVVEGGRRLFPNSKLFAGAHTDGKGHDGCGGKPHVHLIVQNHDVETGKAPKKNRAVTPVRLSFNALGKELGWTETQLEWGSKDQQRVWDKQRAIETAKVAELSNNPERSTQAKEAVAALENDVFGQQLCAKIMAARDAAQGETFKAWQESFAEHCASEGVTFKTVQPKRMPGTKKRPSSTLGVVFRMKNETTKLMNTRKASDLPPGFKLAELQQFYREQQQLEAEQLTQPKTEAIPEPVATEITETVESVAPAEVVEPVSAPAAIITDEQQQQLNAFIKSLERKRDKAELRIASAKPGDTTHKIQSKVAEVQNKRLDILTAHRVNDDLHAALIQVETWQREDAEKEAEKAQKKVNLFAMPETAPNAGIQQQHP